MSAVTAPSEAFGLMAIRLLSISLVSSRVFPTWSMAHLEGERLGRDLLERLIGRVIVERDTSASVRVLQTAISGIGKAT